MMRTFGGVTAALLLATSPAWADSLTPTTFSGSVAIGSTISVTPSKVGTITAGMPTTAQADVLFVTDTTGSMGAALSEISSTFASTVSSLQSLGSIATGAAEYKDATNSPGDGFDYKLDQAITTNSAATQAALNALSAAGGGDDPEQALYALTQASGSTTGFRDGSKKVVVLVGDAPSHDLTNPISAGGASVVSTAAALQAAGVTVVALNASNITGDSGLNDFGQFSGAASIYAAGASGSYTANFPSASNLTSTLEALIGQALSTYSNVSLDLVGPAPTNCSVSLPSAVTGSFSRSTTNTFDFGAVNITGTSAGTCSFTVALEADGGILATETDTVTVGGTGPTPVPEPSSVVLLAAGLLGMAGIVRARRGQG